MLTIRYGNAPPTTGAPPRETTPEEHRHRAAWHLYELVKPADGLTWWLLTDAQRARFISLIRLAERASDFRAVQAANEAVAKQLACNNDESLADLPLPIRGQYRVQAVNLLLLFQRVMQGTPDADEKILALLNAEAEQRYGRRI